MKTNMGNLDRVVRLAIAVVIAALYFTETTTGATGIALLVLAAVFALTSFIRICPLYLPFGISTRPKK